MRWPHGQYLIDEQGRVHKAWQIATPANGPGASDPSGTSICIGTWKPLCSRFPFITPIFQCPSGGRVSRQGKGRRPWYLLTTEEVRTEKQAWRIVFASVRRWDIEGMWRFDKSEMGFECPRLRSWEWCRKLLLMATLASAFLLTLVREEATGLRTWLLLHFCHRTGAKAQRARLPLYRLRLALSRLWLRSPPRFEFLAMRRLA